MSLFLDYHINVAEDNSEQPKPQNTESKNRVDLGQALGGRTDRRAPTPEEMAQAKAEEKEQKKIDKQWLDSLPEDERKRRIIQRQHVQKGPVAQGKQRSSRGYDTWVARDIEERGTGDK